MTTTMVVLVITGRLLLLNTPARIDTHFVPMPSLEACEQARPVMEQTVIDTIKAVAPAYISGEGLPGSSYYKGLGYKIVSSSCKTISLTAETSGK